MSAPEEIKVGEAVAGEDRYALRELIVLASPVVAAMMSYTLMQFVDRFMVSRLGPDPAYLGGQGNGGLLSWVPMSMAVGTITVVNTFVAQNLGAGRPKKGPAYVFAGLWIAIAYWLVVLMPLGCVLPWVVELLSHMGGEGSHAAGSVEASARRDGYTIEYGRILLFGGVFTLAAKAVAQFFYGMHRPRVVLTAVIAANLTNFALNSLFVYGPVAGHVGWGPLDAWLEFTAWAARGLGVPRMEVAGSAYATVIATMVECAVPLGVFLSRRTNAQLQTRSAWRVDFSRIREIVGLGWANGAMFGNEMICWFAFMVVLVGKFGAMHSAAGWIAHQYMSLSFMPAVGLSVAMTAMVGKAMGGKRPDIAERRTWLGVKVAATYMTLCGVIFVVFRGPLADVFIGTELPAEQAAQMRALAGSFLIATACFQFFDGCAMTISGALRGAGDTRWPGVVTVFLSWTVIVGGGRAMVWLAPQLESLGPWIAAAAYIIILSIVLVLRFVSGAWKRIKLVS